MSDPLGIAASVIAVLQLAASATQYLKDVKHGSVDRMRLRDELRSTTCLLDMLRDRLEDEDDSIESGGDTRKPMSIKSLAGLDGPLNVFMRILQDIITKLAPQDRLRQLSRPLIWPFEKKEIAEMLISLERLKSHCSLIMQNDLLELAKLSNLKINDIGQKFENSEARSRHEEEQSIILWVSNTSFRARHISVLESVQPGTGAWLLEDETFCNWVVGNIDILWCPGIREIERGSSLIIEHLKREDLSESICTFIYCDYSQQREQSTVALLSSILQQILQHSHYLGEPLSSEVSSLYNLHKKYDTRPTLTQITDVIRKLAGKFGIVHVVIDALDECAESEEDALQLISVVRSLGPQIKILCTSRFSTTIERYFDGTRRLEIFARSSDISLFLDSQIKKQYRLSRHIGTDPSLEGEIIETIIKESQGMFLLAKLHIESLSQKISRKDVRSSLRTLPTTLDATYSDALRRIYSQAPDAMDIAESILFWVICAKRSLTVRELQHIYATRELSEDTVLEEDDLPDGDILTGLCGGLIIVDSETHYVRVVHYTAQQYFERSRSQELMDARLSLVNVCLKYLTLPNFFGGVCTTDLAMSRCLDRYPFLDYATRHWGSDIGKFDFDHLASLQKFTSCSAAVELTNQVSNIPSVHYKNWSQEFPRGVPSLVLAAAFDVPRILRRMVHDGHNIEGKGSNGETALIRAATFGHIENVRVLLELGAVVNARDYMDETALQKAARAGNEKVVRVLLGGNAEVNLKASSDWTVLMSAVSSGNLEVVQMLVQADADLAAETVWGDSALSIAARNGQEAIATFLADHGAILPHNPAGRRASVVASRKGFQQLVRRLTVDYEAVAGKPLERQNSRIMGGLTVIHEAEGRPTDTQSRQLDTQIATANSNESVFSDFMESLDYVGSSRRYDLIRSLGKGNSAEVFLGANKATNVLYAVKVFTVTAWGESQYFLHNIRREYQVLEELRKFPHPNIIRLVDLFADYTLHKVYLVQELATEGELFNYITMKKKLTQGETRNLISQVFSALDFLHNRGYIHRDIKPENILIADQQNLVIKIADFGLAKKISTEMSEEFTTTLCGTPSYVAPEVLENSKSRRYSFPVDIWSCGVVLYICLCGFPPFSDELYSEEYPYKLTDQIREGKFDYPSPYWNSVGDSALDLIDKMLTVDINKRYTIKDCINHVWILEKIQSI
ncbi:serine threonine- kinase chk2 protein [Rutstroemia sp. NJR-2017a WRK4]|nr:serine threonine- kinase chk2 protein [Rutstroemia sp. NJR-2017a WRK4]